MANQTIEPIDPNSTLTNITTTCIYLNVLSTNVRRMMFWHLQTLLYNLFTFLHGSIYTLLLGMAMKSLTSRMIESNLHYQTKDPILKAKIFLNIFTYFARILRFTYSLTMKRGTCMCVGLCYRFTDKFNLHLSVRKTKSIFLEFSFTSFFFPFFFYKLLLKIELI